MHFEDGLAARQKAGETTKLVAKVTRSKSASEKLTEEGLNKLSARATIQVMASLYHRRDCIYIITLMMLKLQLFVSIFRSE